MYINQLNNNNICVSEDILVEKAKEIAEYFPDIKKSGFSFSNGWIKGFKERYIDIVRWSINGRVRSCRRGITGSWCQNIF